MSVFITKVKKSLLLPTKNIQQGFVEMINFTNKTKTISEQFDQKYSNLNLYFIRIYISIQVRYSNQSTESAESKPINYRYIENEY